MRRLTVLTILVTLGIAGITPILDRPATSPAGVVKPASGRAPVRSGNDWFCPPSSPLATYLSGRTIFEPGNPLATHASVKPARCYSNLGEAISAGYRLARLPPGARYVDGIVFLPAPATFTAACAKSSTDLTYAAPCPTLIPSWLPTGAPPSCSFGCAKAGDRFQFQMWGFSLPVNFEGFGGQPYGHLVIGGVRVGADLQRELALWCPRTHEVARLRVNGWAAGLYRCPPGESFLAGSTQIRWGYHGGIYGVSIQSQDARAVDIVRAVAASIRMRQTPAA